MKEIMKRLFTFFLCMLMLFSSSAFPLYSYAKTSEIIEERQNPFYAGREISYATLDSVDSSVKHSTVKTLDSQKFYSDGEELYKTLRINLVNRKENFQLFYLSKSKIFIENVMSIIEKIYVNSTDEALSESPIDGDYIRWVVSSFSLKRYSLERVFNEKYINGYYYYTFDLKFTYYDSAEEETQVDKVVNSFVSSINTNALTDYEVIKKIHDFICSKTTYDYDALEDPYNCEYAATAYGALVNGKCVCQGYAVAFYRLCKELGYNCRFVSSDATWGCHAWNIVELDGKYYFVDTTWDDGYMESEQQENAYLYFLVNYETLRSKDSFKSEHLLDYKYYDTESFAERYGEYFAKSNYDSENKSLFSQHIISLSASSFTYSGKEFKPAYEVKGSSETPVYTVSYADNKNTGKASVNFYSKEDSSLLSHRNFTIAPKKMTSLSLADSGRETNAIRLNWSKAPGGISGYKLEIYKDGKWSVYKTLSAGATTCKLSSLSPSTTYKFRIRSYKTVSKRTLYGAYSNVYINATKPKTPAASSISSKSNSITFKWKKAACSGYEIQYSQNSSMKNAKTVTASSSALSKKVSKLKKGKKYYFRVRAYKNFISASGTKLKCYSSWSSKKSISCK